MVLLNSGLFRIRNFIAKDTALSSGTSSAIDKGILGTDGTRSRNTDTALGYEISATEQVLTARKSDDPCLIEWTYILDSATGIGYRYSEYGLKDDSSSTYYVRRIFTSFKKSPYQEEDIIVLVMEFKRGE